MSGLGHSLRWCGYKADYTVCGKNQNYRGQHREDQEDGGSIAHTLGSLL